MPSGPIRHPERAGRKRIGRVWRFGLVGLIALTFTACAEGTAREAERGKEQDAERTSVVDDIQATESAGFLLPGTATPPLPEDNEDSGE